MKASDLIDALQAAIYEHGDLPVTIDCDYGFRDGDVGRVRPVKDGEAVIALHLDEGSE